MSETMAAWVSGGRRIAEPGKDDIPVAIALRRAMICVDCDRIFEATRDGRCPLCGSAAAVPVGRWLPGLAGG
jgi:rubrerythrin